MKQKNEDTGKQRKKIKLKEKCKKLLKRNR